MKTKDKGDVIATEQRRLVFCFILGGGETWIKQLLHNNSSVFTLFCSEHQTGDYECQKEQAIPGK